MGSDFNSCRFDFRLDVKTGLLPSRRRRGCSTTGDRSIPATTGASRATPKNDRAEIGSQCNVLYSCKICGCLLRSRADRKAHTLQHKQISRLDHSRTCQPNSDLTNKTSSLNQSLLMLGVTHSGLTTKHGSQHTEVESSAGEHPLLSELATANGFLRSSFRPKHLAEISLPSAEVSQESRDVIRDHVVCDGMTSSLLCFPPLNDVIRSCDRDSAAGIVPKSDSIRMYSSDSQSNEVLDLTIKAACDNNSRLPVPSTDGPCNSDFQSSLARKRKSRGLDLTVQKLWQIKLQQHSACAASDVISCNLEKSMTCDNGDDPGTNPGSPSQLFDENASKTRHPMEERPSFETAVGKVIRSRSPGHGESHMEAELKLRRVMAAPGEQPLFYTSLMRLQSPSRKTPAQVSHFSYLLTYLLSYYN